MAFSGWRKNTLGLLLLALCACARADKAADEFDYWILALSWSPQYCEERANDPQCRRQYDFVVHGLWPQFEKGYPEFCGPREDVEDSLVQRMLSLMPSPSLIRHQWNKHGTCSGLSQEDYFLTAEMAERSLVLPESLQAPRKFRKTTLADFEQELMDINPGLLPEGIAVQCTGRWLEEVRICYDRDFNFRACASDVKDRCRGDIAIRPMR